MDTRSREGHPLRLASIRRARNITQAEVAKELNIHQSVVSRLESHGDFRWSTTLKFLRALGVVDAEFHLRFENGDEVVLPVRPGG